MPEPPALGYIPPYAPATAPPATDIKPLPGVRPLAPGAVLYECPGYSGLQTTNPLPSVLADIFAWGTFAPYKVGNGSGNVNWRLNPYTNASWYLWLHSLRWIGQAITAGAAGNVTALNHARAIAKDWIRDNPYPWTYDVGAHESTMHRTNVLLCLREAIVSTSPGGVLPASDAWLNSALLTHAAFIRNYWSGPGNNHGTDESIALLGVGCVLGRSDLRNIAITRLSQGITTVIDTQGANNEQSTAYAQFNYALWGRAEEALTTCHISPGTTIAGRRALLARFVAQSTNPLGKLAQIGDSEVVSTVPFPVTDLEWAGSQGTRGRAPTVNVSRYLAGYVFGRSGWGAGSTPFRQESSYSLRYGPARAGHGHYDHTSLTYVARGRDILIDGGHPGYVNNGWRAWALSPYAHNVMTVPTAKPLPAAATRLARYNYQSGAQFFEVSDQPNVGVSRVRAVLVLHNPDVVVVLDRGHASTANQWQTLWHLPSDQGVRVYSRTTAIATKAGDSTRTIVFQVPFRQALPAGATLAQRGLTSPRIQGWHFPSITRRNAATTVMFARSATTASILSVIAPVRQSAGVSYSLRSAGSGWTNLYLSVGGTRVLVRISPGNALMRG
ncbi:MAG TPA: heparinase II/III family protein [Dermatophilaceae bacterium]